MINQMRLQQYRNLMETFMIEGNIITIDAMRTQTNIANKIIK